MTSPSQFPSYEGDVGKERDLFARVARWSPIQAGISTGWLLDPRQLFTLANSYRLQLARYTHRNDSLGLLISTAYSPGQQQPIEDHGRALHKLWLPIDLSFDRETGVRRELPRRFEINSARETPSVVRRIDLLGRGRRWQKAYAPEAVREVSFAPVTNGCRRNYLIAVGQAPLIDAFLSYISRREIERTIRSRCFIIVMSHISRGIFHVLSLRLMSIRAGRETRNSAEMKEGEGHTGYFVGSRNCVGNKRRGAPANCVRRKANRVI